MGVHVRQNSELAFPTKYPSRGHERMRFVDGTVAQPAAKVDRHLLDKWIIKRPDQVTKRRFENRPTEYKHFPISEMRADQHHAAAFLAKLAYLFVDFWVHREFDKLSDALRRGSSKMAHLTENASKISKRSLCQPLSFGLAKFWKSDIQIGHRNAAKAAEQMIGEAGQVRHQRYGRTSRKHRKKTQQDASERVFKPDLRFALFCHLGFVALRPQ